LWQQRQQLRGSVRLPEGRERRACDGVAESGLGKILVNSKDRTLYLFQKDTGTTSTCTGACAVDERKYYAAGIGEVREQVTQGGHERFELVSVTRS
jgi:secreted repeat protein with Y-X4-D motif